MSWDWLDAQRLLTALVMPLPLGLGLAIAGCALGWWARTRRWGLALVSGGVGILVLAASPLVAGWLMGALQADYPPRLRGDCPKADAIVLLGGAIQPWLASDVRPRLHRGSDRVWEAARLFHEGCAPLVVVSAGGVAEPLVRAPESEATAALLVDLGVPRSAIALESESRNTVANAAFTRRMLAPLGVRRVLLVTSGWHLRRAVGLFEREGFEVMPAGADYRAVGGCRGVKCWMPSAEALEETGLAIKEYLGIWVQLGGWA